MRASECDVLAFLAPCKPGRLHRHFSLSMQWRGLCAVGLGRMVPRNPHGMYCLPSVVKVARSACLDWHRPICMQGLHANVAQCQQ